MMLRLPHVSFVFAAFFVLYCKSARVIYSEFEPNRQMMVPDDDETDWPSPDQIYFDLGESLDGNVETNVRYLFHTKKCSINDHFSQIYLGKKIFPQILRCLSFYQYCP